MGELLRMPAEKKNEDYELNNPARRTRNAFMDKVWDLVDDVPHMSWLVAEGRLEEVSRLGEEVYRHHGGLMGGQAVQLTPLVREIVAKVKLSCPWPELEEAEAEGLRTVNNELSVEGGLSPFFKNGDLRL